VFGTANSQSDDMGLVLGVCAIYPDEFFFPQLCACFCLFVCLFLSPSLHQGKFYNTTFRQQQQQSLYDPCA